MVMMMKYLRFMCLIALLSNCNASQKKIAGPVSAAKDPKGKGVFYLLVEHLDVKCASIVKLKKLIEARSKQLQEGAQKLSGMSDGAEANELREKLQILYRDLEAKQRQLMELMKKVMLFLVDKKFKEGYYKCVMVSTGEVFYSKKYLIAIGAADVTNDLAKMLDSAINKSGLLN